MRILLLLAYLFTAGAVSAGDGETITVSIATPHPGFTIEIKQVHTGGNRTLVLAQVTEPPADRDHPLFLVTQYDTVLAESDVPDDTVFYIIGHSWNWIHPRPDMVFIKDRQAYYDEVRKTGARLVNITRR